MKKNFMLISFFLLTSFLSCFTMEMENNLSSTKGQSSYHYPTQKEIDLFLDEVVGKAKIPSNSELFMTLAPKALEGMENQREVLKDLSYGFQLLGDWFLCEEAKERASLAYYQSYQFNPENQELLDFFNKNGISNPTPEHIESALKN